MFDLDWPGSYGQENDPHCPPSVETTPAPPSSKKRRRSDALGLSEDEARHVRVAVRKLRRVVGSFALLGEKLSVPANTLRRIANPNTTPPTGTLAIRIAAYVGMSVEDILTGKLVVTPATIGRAA